MHLTDEPLAAITAPSLWIPLRQTTQALSG